LTSIAYDLRYLGAGLEVLEEYLLSKEIYFPMQVTSPDGETPYPQLTLGNILLAKARLESRSLELKEENELTRMILELERIRAHWRVAWETKAQRSFSARLRSWGDFMAEYDAQPGNHFDRYAYEVRLRVILDLLSAQAGTIPEAERGLLDVLDYHLKAKLIPAGFIWQSEIEKGFPPEEYWYLYGTLSKGRDSKGL